MSSADVPNRLPKLRLKSVNHISRVCSDVERSVAFYRDVLGFIPVRRPDTFNNAFDGFWLHGFGMGLHLIKGEPVPRSSRIDPRSDHLSFQADSLEEVAAQLAACGVPFVRQLVVEDGIEVSQLFFHDCDRNMIEVCNCDCLPVVPLEAAPACTLGHACASNACAPHHAACGAVDDDEMSSDGTRDSLDSSHTGWGSMSAQPARALV